MNLVKRKSATKATVGFLVSESSNCENNEDVTKIRERRISLSKKSPIFKKNGVRLVKFLTKQVSILGVGETVAFFRECFEFTFRTNLIEGYLGDDNFRKKITFKLQVTCYKLPFYTTTKEVKFAFVKKASILKEVSDSEGFIFLLRVSENENVEFIQNCLEMMKVLELKDVPILVISEEASELEKKSSATVKYLILKALPECKTQFEVMDYQSPDKFSNINKIIEKWMTNLSVD
jgi:hypothetical protein